jgi:hypothetical protein
MNNRVKTKFISINLSERAEMIASVHKYVDNDQFINLIQNIDINDDSVKHKTKRTNIYWISVQLIPFNANPELCGQIDSWLKSY